VLTVQTLILTRPECVLWRDTSVVVGKVAVRPSSGFGFQSLLARSATLDLRDVVAGASALFCAVVADGATAGAPVKERRSGTEGIAVGWDGNLLELLFC
jgi:hypothetical protein